MTASEEDESDEEDEELYGAQGVEPCVSEP